MGATQNALAAVCLVCVCGFVNFRFCFFKAFTCIELAPSILGGQGCPNSRAGLGNQEM
jgi:hypothetical protein